MLDGRFRIDVRCSDVGEEALDEERSGDLKD